jgi:hypothetical protein
MKAKLIDLSALPIDRMDLVPLPPGELDVVINLRCDREAYVRLVEFFREIGVERADKYGPPSSDKSLEAQKKALPGKPTTY